MFQKLVASPFKTFGVRTVVMPHSSRENNIQNIQNININNSVKSAENADHLKFTSFTIGCKCSKNEKKWTFRNVLLYCKLIKKKVGKPIKKIINLKSRRNLSRSAYQHGFKYS